MLDGDALIGCWASDPSDIKQVGCAYRAQVFEFDYVGVIVGPDLVYRPLDRGWVGQSEQSRDRVVRRGVSSAEFTRYVKSTHRVLLARGLRGCYLHFMDARTRDFFITRTKQSQPRERAADSPAPNGHR